MTTQQRNKILKVAKKHDALGVESSYDSHIFSIAIDRAESMRDALNQSGFENIEINAPMVGVKNVRLTVTVIR